MKAIGAIMLSLAAGAAGNAPLHTGGWCRPSNGVELKSDLRYQDPERTATSAEGCFRLCAREHGSNLACAEFASDNACYCMRKAVTPGGPETDFCWSKTEGSRTYVRIDKPPDCGQGYDCCSCDLAGTDSGHGTGQQSVGLGQEQLSSVGMDNCGSWDWSEEKKFCMDDVSIPVPTGEQCYSGSGEVHTCCRPCGVGEVANRQTQVCPCGWGHDDWKEAWRVMMTFSVVPAFVSIICVVAGSMVVCFGVGKGSNLVRWAVFMGAVACLCMFGPLMGASVATSASTYCERCDCDAQQDLKDGPHVFSTSVFVAYSFGGGIFVVALAATAVVLACCMCRPCCGPLLADQRRNQVQAGVHLPAVVVGQVVGLEAQGDNNRDRHPGFKEAQGDNK